MKCRIGNNLMLLSELPYSFTTTVSVPPSGVVLSFIELG